MLTFNSDLRKWALVGAAAVLLGVLLVLAAPTPWASAQAGSRGHVLYMENSNGPVRHFSAVDPEGGGILWAVEGLDADDFEINSDGVLSFRQPPDYEQPTDRGRKADPVAGIPAVTGGDNIYHVTVRASEATSVSALLLSSSTSVTIEVTNVEEPGTLNLNRLQPEVGTPITARLHDPAGVDGPVAWAWAVSKVSRPDPAADSQWNTVAGETAATYVPRGDRVDGAVDPADDPGTAIDEGRHLRVTASYQDGGGLAKVLTAMSVLTVRAEVSSDNDGVENAQNGSPGFSPSGDYSREIPEDAPPGTPVGEIVRATDPNDDALSYELDNNAESADALDVSGPVGHFTIDIESGQIFVSGIGVDHEASSGQYQFYVRAVDPSGESAVVEIAVTATDVNDVPAITGVTVTTPPARHLRIYEHADGGHDNGAPDLNVVLATSSRNVFRLIDGDLRGQNTWSLEGEDARFFTQTSASSLGGGGQPTALIAAGAFDYENPTDSNGDNVYDVTLVANDSRGASSRLDLTVRVLNVPEEGGMGLRSDGSSQRQPRVGETFTASVSDPDGRVAVVTWQWRRSGSGQSGAPHTVIPGATAPEYTITEDDLGHYLAAAATYTDRTSDPDDPQTPQIDERVQKLVAGRVVAKNAGGASATDRLYRAVSTTAHAVVAAAGPVLMPPTVTEGFALPLQDRGVPENSETGTLVGLPVRAVNPHEGGGTTYSLVGRFATGLFTIDDHGQIRVGSLPYRRNPSLIDLPATAAPVPALVDPPLDHEGGVSTYTAYVTATITDGDNRRVSESSSTVRVGVTDIDESPYFSKQTLEKYTATVTFAENARNRTVASLRAVEPDGNGLTWSLAGLDAESFTVDSQGRLQFREEVDHEDPGSISGTNLYHVTVLVTEKNSANGILKTAEHPLAVEVVNSAEGATIAFSLLLPEVGTPLTAILTAEDAGATDATWSWHRAKVTSPNPNPSIDPADLAVEWTLIQDASGATYTPRGVDNDVIPPVGTAIDESRHLLARVQYTDGEGVVRALAAITHHPVRADVPDRDNNSPDYARGSATLTVSEDIAVGSAIGPAISVEQNEDSDTLTYDLDDDAIADNEIGNSQEVGFFSIDRGDGTVRVAKKLSAEANDGRNYSDPGNPRIGGVYRFVVWARDSSGEGGGEDSDSIQVIVRVTNVEESPTISEGLSHHRVEESDSSLAASDPAYFVGLGYEIADGQAVQSLSADSPNLYFAQDPDASGSLTWVSPIPGPDGALFEYSSAAGGRRLHFKEAPNYEAPRDANSDNIYELDLTVRDSSGSMQKRAIRIRVLNIDEPGELTLTPAQPVAGSPMTATLTDFDGVVYITGWEWATTSRTAAAFPENGIVAGATTNTAEAEVGQFLWVRVQYRDGASVEDHPDTAIDERNDDPATDASVTVETDHDSDRVLALGSRNAYQVAGVPESRSLMSPGLRASSIDASGGGTITLTVPENTPSTGYAGLPIRGLGTSPTIRLSVDSGPFVFAEDHDGANDGYYDSGLAPTVDIDDKIGQLALKPVSNLDYESGKTSYTITIAPGGEGAEVTSDVTVTIRVTDVNEGPPSPVDTPQPPDSPPQFSRVLYVISVAENTAAGENVGSPISAMAADPLLDIAYQLAGQDADAFRVHPGTGQVLSHEALDYEATTTYSLVIQAVSAAGTVSAHVRVDVLNVGLDTPYDSNDNNMIERDEVIDAIGDYLFRNLLTRDEVLDLIRMFLFGESLAGPPGDDTGPDEEG